MCNLENLLIKRWVNLNSYAAGCLYSWQEDFPDSIFIIFEQDANSRSILLDGCFFYSIQIMKGRANTTRIII